MYCYSLGLTHYLSQSHFVCFIEGDLCKMREIFEKWPFRFVGMSKIEPIPELGEILGKDALFSLAKSQTWKYQNRCDFGKPHFPHSSLKLQKKLST